MQSSLHRTDVMTDDGMGAFCYRMRCPSDSSPRPLVRVYGKSDWLQCDENYTLTVEGFNGFIHCPSDRCGNNVPEAIVPPYRWELSGDPPPKPAPRAPREASPTDGYSPSDADIPTPAEILTRAIQDVSRGISDALYVFLGIFFGLMFAACGIGAYVGHKRALSRAEYEYSRQKNEPGDV